MPKPSRSASTGLGRRSRQVIVRLTPARAGKALQKAAGEADRHESVSDLVRRHGGLGLAWQLRKVRELMDGGVVARGKPPNAVITAGTGGLVAGDPEPITVDETASAG